MMKNPAWQLMELWSEVVYESLRGGRGDLAP